jgi:hypothetical protein
MVMYGCWNAWLKWHRGCLVNLRQVLALAALVLFTAIGAHADGAPTGDARIIIGSGGDPVGCGLPEFAIPVNKKDGGSIECINSSGQDWIGLEIMGIAKPGKIMFGPGNVPCGGATSDPGNLFTMCNVIVTSLSKNEEGFIVIFSGGEITPGEAFFINLNTDFKSKGKPGTQGSWIGDPKSHTLIAVPEVAPVPEPGTIALVLSGWGGLWFWRKRHFRN